MLKYCYKCKTEKNKSEFAVCKSNKDGLQTACKPCRHQIYLLTKEKVKENSKKYYIENSKKYKDRQKKYRKENYIRNWCYQTLNKHKKTRGHEIKITIDELLSVVIKSKKCNYCDCDLKWNIGKYTDNSPTLDRLNNENFLSLENIQILCRRCNLSKQDRSHEEFLNFCKRIKNKFDNNQ